MYVDRVRPEYGGTLYLQCPDCDRQTHLLGFRPLPLDLWMIIHEKSEEDEVEYTRNFRDLCILKHQRSQSVSDESD